MPRRQTDKRKQVKSVFGIPDILSRNEVYDVHWNENGPKTIPNPLQSFAFPGEKVLAKRSRHIWTRGEGGQDVWKALNEIIGKWVDRVVSCDKVELSYSV